jgi:hypothetical protein
MSSEPINLIDFSWNKSNTVVESNLKKNSYLKILLFGSLIVTILLNLCFVIFMALILNSKIKELEANLKEVSYKIDGSNQLNQKHANQIKSILRIKYLKFKLKP